MILPVPLANRTMRILPRRGLIDVVVERGHAGATDEASGRLFSFVDRPPCSFGVMTLLSDRIPRSLTALDPVSSLRRIGCAK